MYGRKVRVLCLIFCVQIYNNKKQEKDVTQRVQNAIALKHHIKLHKNILNKKKTIYGYFLDFHAATFMQWFNNNIL